MLNISYKYHIMFAFLLRIALIIYSEYHDQVSEVPYTDVDYKVFTDASRHVLNSNSPFDRHTYRYTPLIAILLIPNILVHSSFGKILFSIIDIIVGLLIRTIVLHSRQTYSEYKQNSEKCQSKEQHEIRTDEKQNVRKRKETKEKPSSLRKEKDEHEQKYDYVPDYCMLFWIYNPMTVIISTRGNCDSIAGCLVLITIYLLQCKQKCFLAGLVHGLAIHVRLYPIMYSLSLFMYLSKFSQYSVDKRITNISYYKSLCNEQEQIGDASELVSSDHSSKQLSNIHLNQNTRKTIFKKEYLYYLIPNTDQVKLISGCVLSLGVSIVFFYYLYGYSFLYETYIYHLVRKDTRHNFSLFFYIQYLTAGIKNIGIWQKVLSILPQIVLLLVLSVRYGLNKFTLSFSILTQTIVIVAYNSVLTSQYFIWILAILPLTLWQFEMTLRSSLLLAVIWFAAQLAWLLPAYLLEFHSQNTFIFIWLQSVSFFCANMAILGRLIKCFVHKNDK